MYTIKYYSRDKFIGEEIHRKLEQAEDSLYQSPLSFRSDYYEIIENESSRIVQEFVIPPSNLTLTEKPEPDPFEDEEYSDWIDWA